MKYLKIILPIFSIFILIRCNTSLEGNSNKHPDFKIGAKGFENNLKKDFDFQKLSIGTYFSKKEGLVKEKGLDLTFEKNNLNQISDSLINVYADIVTNQVSKNLLHLGNYNYVKITFKKEETVGELKKSTEIKIKKELK